MTLSKRNCAQSTHCVRNGTCGERSRLLITQRIVNIGRRRLMRFSQLLQGFSSLISGKHSPLANLFVQALHPVKTPLDGFNLDIPCTDLGDRHLNQTVDVRIERRNERPIVPGYGTGERLGQFVQRGERI